MRTIKFFTPSLLEVEIRETNGADDDILSSVEDPVEMLNRYLASLVLSINGNTMVKGSDIKNLRLRDKYFILIKSRIFSLGEILYFKQEWGNGASPEEFAIDLRSFVWDDPQEPMGPDCIKPYPNMEMMSKTLDSGKQVRMKFMDGNGESMLMKKSPQARTINMQLLARGLQVFQDGDWVDVTNFTPFTSREMAQIRSLYEELDPAVEGLIELVNPATLQPHYISLLEIKDFFFPVKVS